MGNTQRPVSSYRWQKRAGSVAYWNVLYVDIHVTFNIVLYFSNEWETATPSNSQLLQNSYNLALVLALHLLYMGHCPLLIKVGECLVAVFFILP